MDCRIANSGYTLRVIRNLILDWSGTLIDDLPAVWHATNYVLTQAKCEPMTLDEFRAGPQRRQRRRRRRKRRTLNWDGIA